MISLFACAILACAVPPLPAPKPSAERALFPIDPVILLGSGEKMEGVATREANYGGFRYRFATEASQRAFAATPTRFAIGMGGGCARMGPLSGRGDVARYEVVNDRLYIFASDACRASFLKDPSAFLEVADAPFPTDARGLELAAVARRWLRADAACPSEIVVTDHQEVKSGEEMHKTRDEVRLSPNLLFTTLNAWDESVWWTTASLVESAVTDTPTHFMRSTVQGEQLLDDSQLAAFRRVAMVEPLFLSRLLLQSDVKLAGGGAAEWKVGDRTLTGEILKIHWKEVTVEWLIKAATGQPMAQRAMKRSRDARFAQVTEAFSDWNDKAGVRIPMTRSDGVVTRRFDSVESDCDPKVPEAPATPAE